MIITKIQESILQLLAKYKFLTLSQLLQLEVGTTQYKYLWKQMNSLLTRRNSCVDRVRYNKQDRLGKVEDVYYLTITGAQVIQSVDTDTAVVVPKGTPQLTSDYKHRLMTIDVAIGLDLFCIKQRVRCSKAIFYFEFEKSKKLKSKTTISFNNDKKIIPDAVKLIGQKKNERMFLIEVHTGDDARRIEKQIDNHARVLVSGYGHMTFDYPKQRAYYIMIIFETKKCMDLILKRMRTQMEKYALIQQYFILSQYQKPCLISEETDAYTLDGTSITNFKNILL